LRQSYSSGLARRRRHPRHQAGPLEKTTGAARYLAELFLACVPHARIVALDVTEARRHTLAGNLCRCTGYGKIVGAVLGVAPERHEAGG
jgi:hypothetical protein